MPEFDRDRLIETLRRLGDESDTAVLAAAREASRIARDADLSWDDLIAVAGVSAPAPGDTAESNGGAGEKSSDEKLIDRLLARKDISDTLRSDLNDFRRAIAAGTFDKIDADYVRALAKRLGA
jgi:hypothetical protein